MEEALLTTTTRNAPVKICLNLTVNFTGIYVVHLEQHRASPTVALQTGCFFAIHPLPPRIPLPQPEPYLGRLSENLDNTSSLTKKY